jgi:hypothetical protein
MYKVRRLRAMGSLCRQQAAYNPAQSWKLLAEAEYWEHMAAVETASHFEECNTNRSRDLANPAQLLTRMTRDGRRLSPLELLESERLGDFYRAEGERNIRGSWRLTLGH